MKRALVILALAGFFAAWFIQRSTHSRGAVVAAQKPQPAPAAVPVPPAGTAALARPQEAAPSAELPVSRDEQWKAPSSFAPLAAFQSWTSDYAVRPEAGKVAAGVKLAQERRATMRALIQHDPEQALANTVPEALRRTMPEEVKILLEEKVDARGDFTVTAATWPDGRVPQGQRAERARVKLDDGQKFEAFTYGNREFLPSRKNVPIHGIAVDGLLAVSEWPGRVLDPIERHEAKAALDKDPLCPTSGKRVEETGTETAVITGRDVEFYCGPAHANSDLRDAAVTEAGRPPGFGVRPPVVVNAASGAPGQPVPNFLSEGDAYWTTGNKRVGIVRVTFNGANYHDFDPFDCGDILEGMDASFKDWSYGRCGIREVSSTGSFITPVLDLSQSVYYEDDIDSLWFLASAWAMSHGRLPLTYDMLMVLSGNAPIRDDTGDNVTWGGLGRVEGPYTWIRSVTVEKAITVGIHEIGHNFGLRHTSNLWTTPQLVTYIFGQPVYEYGAEYGDRYDRMGSGVEDYNVRLKDWLQWLDDANVPLASTDGRYFLREHDLEEKSGVRGLQVAFNLPNVVLGTEKSLFIEYRNYDTANPLIAYGAHIHLASPGQPKSWLLDCTPETPNHEPDDANGDPDRTGNLDSMLLPGRTFSCTRYNVTVHITNISADPDSGEMEVEINHGSPAGNDAPTGSIATNTPTGAVGQKIYFTANASDPDADDLAYHWQIPGAGPLENKNTAQFTFNTTGTKAIKCIVSDKHGGVTTLTRNFSIANNQPPSIGTISDRTMDEDTTLANIPFTVNDPTTPAGSLTVTAVSSNAALFPASSIVLGGSGGNRTIGLTPPANRHGEATITLTVSDGGLQDTEEFKVTVRGVTPGTTLIAAGANWRYWDSTHAPAGNWKVPVYDDSAWGLNDARFVYPYFPGGTVLSTPAGTRLTTYYRRVFLMPSSPVGTPTIKFLCDDGIVIYSNGLEIWRHNMPDGAITHTTRAASSVQGGKQAQWITVPLNIAQFHVGGSNTIAVEVHDVGGTRGAGDVTFDFKLELLQAPVVSNITDKSSPEDTLAGAYNFTATETESPPRALIYSATSSNQALVLDANVKVDLNIFAGTWYVTAMPQPDATGVTEITLKASDGGSETWEKFNLTITPVNDPPYLAALPDMAVPLGEIAPLVPVHVGDVDSPAGSLTVSAVSSNQAVLPNDGIQVLPGPTPSTRWLRLTPNAGIAAQANVTVTVNDGALSSNDIFIFRVSFPFSPTTTDITLVQSGESWRYWAAALPPDPRGGLVDFTDPGLDDRAWPSGPSQLGYGNDGEAHDVPVMPYRVTTYLRKKFTVPNKAAISQLKLRMLRDDGAVVYLNGSQIWSSNMPRVTITPSTLAEDDISGVAEDTWHTTTISTAALVSGSNTLAVELHQSAVPSALSQGDLSFDFEIDGIPAAPLSPDTLIAPGEMWAYWDQDSYPDATWKLATYDQADWKYGLARLGYGIGGESTVVNFWNEAAGQRNPCVLFRKTFDIADPAAFTALHLYIQRDDGVAVHLNGIRVHLENLASTASLGDLALSEVPPAEHTQWKHYLIDPKRLLAGKNLVAVEIHQSSFSGTDLNFDLQLIGDLSGQPTLFMRPVGNDMELSWAAAFNGWSLLQSSNFSVWTPVPQPPLLDGAWIYVIQPNPGARRFYRLERP
jgi:hypothetical protein